MIWGYHHLRKHPYRWILDDSKKTSLQLWKVDNVNLMMVKLPKNQRLDPPKKEGILWLSFLEGSAWDLQTISFLRSHDSLGRWVSGKKQVDFKKKNRLISKRNNFQLIISFFWNPGSFPSSSVHFWCSYFDFLSQVDSNCGKFCIKCHKGPVERASPNDVPMFSEIPARRHDYEQMGFRKRFFVFFSKNQKKHIGQNSAKLFVFTNYGLLFWPATKWLIFHNKLNEGSKTSFGRFNGPTKKQGDDGIVTVSCGKEFKKKHIKEIWTLQI